MKYSQCQRLAAWLTNTTQPIAHRKWLMFVNG
jgi:hypothetical protein